MSVWEGESYNSIARPLLLLILSLLIDLLLRS